MRTFWLVAVLAGLLSTGLVALPAVAQDDGSRPPAVPDLPALHECCDQFARFYLRDSHTSGKATTTVKFPGEFYGLMGDWDGDGDATPGWYDERRGTFNLCNSYSGCDEPDITLHYGPRGTVNHIVGDWNGDGITDIGILMAPGDVLKWYLETDTTNGHTSTDGKANIVFRYGYKNDHPIAGVWRDDGNQGTVGDQIAVVRRRRGQALTWYLETDRDAQGRTTSDGQGNITIHYGTSKRKDWPIAGDWEGDGVDNVGVVRDENRWLLEEQERSDGGARVTASDGQHNLDYRTEPTTSAASRR